MKKIIRFIIKDNKFYTALFAFVLAVNILAFVGNLQEKSDVKGEARKVNAEEMFGGSKAAELKIQKLIVEKPLVGLALGAVNLTVVYALFLGIGLDAYFMVRWARRKAVLDPFGESPEPLWGIGDVARAVLIFLSATYVFMIFQGLAENFFPIFAEKNFSMIFNTAFMNVVGISVIIHFVVKKHKQSVNALGLTLKNGLKNVYCGIVGYVALFPIFVAIMLVTFLMMKFFKYQPPVQPIVEVFMKEQNTSVLLFSAVFAAVFGPVAEEIFFRGFMYSAVKKRAGVAGGMIITAVIFAALHAHIVGFLPIMALSLLLTYLYEKTGSLVAPISVHIVHNLAMVVLVFLARYIGA